MQLSVKRPTATTVQYTVSTRTSPTTLPAHISHSLLLLARIVAACFLATLLLHEYRLVYPSNTDPTSSWTTQLEFFALGLVRSPRGSDLELSPFLLDRLTRPWRVLIIAGIVLLISLKAYVAESLLVIRGLGVQTSSSSSSYLWPSSTRFIPTSSIQDIFIYEAFKGFEVRFFLNIVVEGEETVVVVFPKILPRREILEDVWRGARACLHEPKNER